MLPLFALRQKGKREQTKFTSKIPYEPTKTVNIEFGSDQKVTPLINFVSMIPRSNKSKWDQKGIVWQSLLGDEDADCSLSFQDDSYSDLLPTLKFSTTLSFIPSICAEDNLNTFLDFRASSIPFHLSSSSVSVDKRYKSHSYELEPEIKSESVIGLVDNEMRCKSEEWRIVQRAFGDIYHGFSARSNQRRRKHTHLLEIVDESIDVSSLLRSTASCDPGDEAWNVAAETNFLPVKTSKPRTKRWNTSKKHTDLLAEHSLIEDWTGKCLMVQHEKNEMSLDEKPLDVSWLDGTTSLFPTSLLQKQSVKLKVSDEHSVFVGVCDNLGRRASELLSLDAEDSFCGATADVSVDSEANAFQFALQSKMTPAFKKRPATRTSGAFTRLPSRKYGSVARRDAMSSGRWSRVCDRLASSGDIACLRLDTPQQQQRSSTIVLLPMRATAEDSHRLAATNTAQLSEWAQCSALRGNYCSRSGRYSLPRTSKQWKSQSLELILMARSSSGESQHGSAVKLRDSVRDLVELCAMPCENYTAEPVPVTNAKEDYCVVRVAAGIEAAEEFKTGEESVERVAQANDVAEYAERRVVQHDATAVGGGDIAQQVVSKVVNITTNKNDGTSAEEAVSLLPLAAVPVLSFSLVNTTSLADSYLQLHSKSRERSEDVQRTTTGTTTAHPLLHSPTHASSAHDRSSAQAVAFSRTCKNESVDSKEPFQSLSAPIPLLLSEDCLEDYPLLVRALQQPSQTGESFAVLDVPLQRPVSVIVDESSCICIVSAETLGAEQLQQEMKALLKGLTQIAFKFATIWVVLVTASADTSLLREEINALVGRILQAACRFPVQIVFRECASSSFRDPTETGAKLGHVVRAIVRQAVVARPSNVSLSASQMAASRSFLSTLDPHNCSRDYSAADKSVLMAHCEYLQLFPTVNFHTAALLLSMWQLKVLANILLRLRNQRAVAGHQDSCQLFAAKVVDHMQKRLGGVELGNRPHLQKAMEQFAMLLQTHAGLQVTAL